jgi:PAS domain S-box-containing protein
VGTEVYTLIEKVNTDHQKAETEYFSNLSNKWLFVSIMPSTEGGILILIYNQQEIKEAQQKLEDEHRQLLEAQAIGHIGSFEWVVGNENVIWSDELYRINGMEPQSETITIKKADARVYPEDLASLLKIKETSFHTPGYYQLVHRITSKDGKIRWVNHQFESIAGNNGSVVKVHGTLQDITELKKAEAEIKETEDLIRHTAVATPDAITIYNLKTNQPVYLNNCLAEWLYYSNEELIEMGYEGRLALIYADDQVKLEELNKSLQFAKDSSVTTIEYRIRARDGKTLWIRNRSKVFKRDEKSRPTFLLSVLQDVTDEVALTNQLKERTSYTEAIIDASIDRISVYDKDLKIIAWNKRSEEETGIKKEAIIGKKLWEVFPKITEDEEVYKAHITALKGEHIYLPAKKSIYNHRYYEDFFIPLKDAQGDTYSVVNVMHDVSDLIYRNNELKELNRALEQKNEEAALFTFIASHDLKEPLRKVQMFSNLLIENEKANLSDKGQEYLQRSANAVKRIDLLIEELLALSRLNNSRLEKEQIDLNEVIKKVKEDLADEIETTKASISSEPLPLLKGITSQILYLFKNLFSNALKYTYPGAAPVLNIKAAIVPLPGADTGINYLKISIADKGIGFDQQYEKKIFQMFQRLHSAADYKGTGMGLALCKKIMDNHNGFINAEGAPGQGAVFNCYFPLNEMDKSN